MQAQLGEFSGPHDGCALSSLAGSTAREAVEADETLGPGGIAILGTRRELADATAAAQAVEQARRLGAGQFPDGEAEDVVVEEGEGGVGFFQPIERILLGLGDVLEEAADVAGRKITGVAFVVEQDEAARPVGAAFARAVLST
jgi:hypothetical protein